MTMRNRFGSNRRRSVDRQSRRPRSKRGSSVVDVLDSRFPGSAEAYKEFRQIYGDLIAMGILVRAGRHLDSPRRKQFMDAWDDLRNAAENMDDTFALFREQAMDEGLL